MKGSLLVVEDNLDLLGLYREMFEMVGFSVEAISSGEDAIRRYRDDEARPDVVILDHRLQGLSGLDVARTMLSRYPDQPIILTTADDSVRDEALSIGVSSFKRKPVSNRELVQEVLSLASAAASRVH